MKYSEVDSLIYNELSKIPNLPKLQLPNTTAITGQPYCRITPLPAKPIITYVLGYIGSDEIKQGLYQIDLFYPPNDGDVDIDADNIIEHFKIGPLSNGNITIEITSCYPQPSKPIDKYHNKIVVIEWSNNTHT